MSKKVFIGVGHGGTDSGAVANGLKEKNVNLDIALSVKSYLEKCGVTVGISRTKDENDRLAEEIKECNTFNPDLAVEIHNNAGGGDGCEVYYSKAGGTSKTLAANIESAIKAIGQNSRGCKTKLASNGTDYFGWVRETKAPAALVECAFMDNANDVKMLNSASARVNMGVAIAKGVLKTLGMSVNIPVTAPNKVAITTPKASGVKYKVTGSWCNIRKGAGTNFAKNGIVKKNEIYTIMATSKGQGAKLWGKLKSGAGWIALDFCKKL